MDAKRFLRAITDACVTARNCEDCKIFKYCHMTFGLLSERHIAGLIAAAEEIPDGRTYEERFFDAFPDAPREEDGSPVACLCDIFPDAGGVCEVPYGEPLPANCAECWRRVST